MVLRVGTCDIKSDGNFMSHELQNYTKNFNDGVTESQNEVDQNGQLGKSSMTLVLYRNVFV